jgi:hypothetical protein
MSSRPVFLLKSFSREEITAVARLMIKDEAETQEFAGLFMEEPHGAVLDSEDEFLTILGLMSDDLTVRVGALRGLTPDQARAWASAILEEDGHPSTWTFERDEDDEEGSPPRK